MNEKSMSANPPSRHGDSGFTLVEMAIVLIIVALLVGGTTIMLSAVQDNNNVKETQRRLALAQEALLGFAAGNGRLPCPAAAPDAGGSEAPADASGACTAALNGFLPALTLGLAPTDAQGYLVDAWGNRVRYAVFNGTIATHANPFTTPGKMKEIGIETLSMNPFPTPRPLLYVCDSGAGVGAADCGTAQKLTDNAVAVVFSMGKNGGVAGAGNEAENTDGDIVFVSMTSPDFDDVVAWLSPNILYNRLITAGRLP